MQGQDNQPNDLVLDITFIHRRGGLGFSGMPAIKNCGIVAKGLLDRIDTCGKDLLVFDDINITGVGKGFVSRTNQCNILHDIRMPTPTPTPQNMTQHHNIMYQLQNQISLRNRRRGVAEPQNQLFFAI